MRGILRMMPIPIPLLLAACDSKPLPVELKQRRALLAGGKVAIFKNTSNKTLSVVAVFENAGFRSEHRFDLVLPPGESTKIGGFEGWQVQSGETVKLYSDGYETATYTFNE